MIDEKLYYTVIRVVLFLWIINFIAGLVSDFVDLGYTQAGVINGTCGGIIGVVVAAGVKKHLEKSDNSD